MTLSTTSPRARRRWSALAGFVFLASIMSVSTAFASHPEVSLAGSNFEIDTDANIKVDDASPSIDWANVTEIRKADSPSGNNDESFGQGAKEDTAVPSVVDGGIPPNKSDLKFFGVYQEGSSTSGFLNLFWSRVQDPSGTTNMDFEFNKRQCTPNASPADADCSGNGMTPIRSAGDLLIIYDLSQGGVNPTLSIRTWTGSAWGPATNLTSSTKATGSINTSAIPAADSDGLGAHSARTFGEAQIALSSIFTDSSVCTSFGSAYLKSRSSDSFTAALKDFVPPVGVNISNCGSIEITKTDDAGTPNPLSGATFTLYKDNAPTGGSRGAEDTITTKTCTTGNDGKCTISNVLAGQYWVVETTTPTGYDTAADQHASVTADTIVKLTFVDPRQRGVIVIEKSAKHKDSNTSPNLVATFTVKKGTTVIGTITTDANGDGCLGNLLFDTYTVVETGPPSGYSAAASQSVTVDSAGTCASNTATAASFVNVPLTDITVSVDSQVPGGTNSTMVCKQGTTTKASGSTAADGDGSITASNLEPGTYVCTIVVDP